MRPSTRQSPPFAPRRRTWALGLTAALSAAIFVLALIPLDTPPSMPGTDKLHHFIAFAILTLPCAILHVRALPWALPAFILEAGLIEIVQPYANRFREWADFTADLKGIAIGLALGLAIRSIGLVTSRKSERRR